MMKTMNRLDLTSDTDEVDDEQPTAMDMAIDLAAVGEIRLDQVDAMAAALRDRGWT